MAFFIDFVWLWLLLGQILMAEEAQNRTNARHIACAEQINP